MKNIVNNDKSKKKIKKKIIEKTVTNVTAKTNRIKTNANLRITKANRKFLIWLRTLATPQAGVVYTQQRYVAKKLRTY